uniref:SKP1/BTB/POZ domain-containing protein n=1 Tax=Tanacetum cinerariifolium TaxID=118510 RepID=A0A6L2L3G6_TANCI|nr:SKP1/BTB/POZ domain-containing protein [Tanacetum cinerariifolium]
MRNIVRRDRYGAHDRLVTTYFSANPMYDAYRFRKRFRMSRELFTSIVEEMASSLVKRVASSLKRVRAIASSSRFFNIKGFEYDQRLFDPRLSPTRNLARLLTVTDGLHKDDVDEVEGPVPQEEYIWNICS